LLRESNALVARGDAAMRSLVERLRARFVSVTGAYFTNVNAPEDLERVVRMGAR
jgi:molybdopterin-guanine dinucleotide biosynthesis protein A